MQKSRRIILQPDPNPVRLLHHVAVGNDITFGIDDHPGTQRAFANCSASRTSLASLSALTSEKPVKEVVKGVPLIIIGAAAPSALGLDGGFGVDVHYRGLELLGYLGELVR